MRRSRPGPPSSMTAMFGERPCSGAAPKSWPGTLAGQKPAASPHRWPPERPGTWEGAAPYTVAQTGTASGAVGDDGSTSCRTGYGPRTKHDSPATGVDAGRRGRPMTGRSGPTGTTSSRSPRRPRPLSNWGLTAWPRVEGAAGADAHPDVDGTDATASFEHYECSPSADRPTDPTVLWPPVHTHIRETGEDETFHDPGPATGCGSRPPTP